MKDVPGRHHWRHSIQSIESREFFMWPAHRAVIRIMVVGDTGAWISVYIIGGSPRDLNSIDLQEHCPCTPSKMFEPGCNQGLQQHHVGTMGTNGSSKSEPQTACENQGVGILVSHRS